MRPGMKDVMMTVARTVSQRSTCGRLQVGAVIADLHLRQILSFGYNGNWSGGPNRCDGSMEGACGCLHAEENALIKLTSNFEDLCLFTTHTPCPLCCKRIVNQGKIRLVYYDELFRDTSGLKILEESNVAHVHYMGAPLS